jgi:hypothetical protein
MTSLALGAASLTVARTLFRISCTAGSNLAMYSSTVVGLVLGGSMSAISWLGGARGLSD